jgi:hypothetical protein
MLRHLCKILLLYAVAAAFGTGAGLFLLDNPLRGQWIVIDADRTSGPKGDSTLSGGGTDDTTAINTYLSAANPYDTIVLGGTDSGRSFRITAPINIPPNVNFKCYGNLVKTDSDNETAVNYGHSASLNYQSSIYIDAVVRVSQSDWTSEANVGITMINPAECDIEIGEVKGFTIGVQFHATNGFPAAYNKNVKLGHLVANKVGLDMHSFSAGSYINENSFLGGRYTYATGVNPSKDRYGVRFVSEAGAETGPNNNVWYAPTFEMGNVDAGAKDAVAVLMENNGLYNAFYGYRSEFNDTQHIVINGTGAAYNVFEPLWASGVAWIQSPFNAIRYAAGTRRADVIKSPELKLYEPMSWWGSGDLVSKTVQRDAGSGFSWTYTSGIHWERYADTGTPDLIEALVCASDGEYMVSGTGLASPCIVVDSTMHKRFVVRKRVLPADPGRWAVRCYNGHPLDGGTIIGSASPVLVKGAQAGTDPFWDGSGFGGVYVRGSDSDDDWSFTVDDTVKYFVLICYGASVSEFGIGAIDPWPIHCFPLTGVNDGVLRLDGPPDVGTTNIAPFGLRYKLGTTVFNSAPALLGTNPWGWTCTTVDPITFTPFYRGAAAIDFSQTWDPADTADGAMTSKSDFGAVTGAVLGDYVSVAAPYELPAGVTCTASVQAAGVLRVTLFNKSGGNVDLASGTWKFRVHH